MLEPSADEIREWGNSVTQFMIEYLGGLRDRPVYRHTSSREIRSGLDSKLPIKGTDFDSLLKVFRDTIVPFSRQNAHPRMFGYVQSPGTPIGAFADLLASTLNANLTIWRSAPAPVELERLTIDWIRQILGFNPEAGGLFVSGGSMANLAALAAARQTKYDSLGRLRMYASSATHFSITKAAALLGIGRENVQHVAVDERFRMRVDDLVAKITADLEAGYVPLLRRWECRNRGYRRGRSLTRDSRSCEPVPALDARGWKLWCLRHSRAIGEKIIRGHGAGGFHRAGSSQMALSARWMLAA